MISRNDMIRKTMEYILVGIIIFVIILALIYALFIKKDKTIDDVNKYDDTVYTDKTFTKLEKVILTNENKVIKVNKKKIFAKVVDDYLYIDDKIASDTVIPMENGKHYIYYNDYLIFIYQAGTNYDGLVKVINEEREDVLANMEIPFAFLNFNNDTLSGISYTINNGYAENKYYVFKYDGKELTINEMYPEIKKIEKINLNSNNRIMEINNKNVNLKVINNELYFNNVKMEGTYIENVYLTNYLLLFSNTGECGEIINMAIDENGNLIRINSNDYQIHDIRMENNKLIANGDKCICEEDACNKDALREINYNGQNVTIR